MHPSFDSGLPHSDYSHYRNKKGGEVFGQIHELACEGQALYSRKATSEETSSAMKPFLGSKGTSSSPV